MSGPSAKYPCDEDRRDRGAATSLRVVEWLAFAATPSFLAMAILTATHPDSPSGLLCSPSPDVSPLGGMLPMYALMSAFHSAPWVRLMLQPRMQRSWRET